MTGLHRLIAAGLATAATVAPALAQGSPDPDWAWHYGWGMGGLMFGGGLVMLLFWGGLILLVVLLVRWLGGVSPPAGSERPGQSALAILEERFARGEIDQQEFENRRKILSGR
jgi:putative membrane protein